MRQLSIKVCGPQFGEPGLFTGALQRLTGAELQLKTLGEADEVLEAVLPDFSGSIVTVSAVKQPLFFAERSYAMHIADADGIIYLLAGARSFSWLNDQDFELFYRLYKQQAEPIPVVVLLNDMWCGGFSGDLLSLEDVSSFAKFGLPVVRTQIGHGCQEGLWEALETVLALRDSSVDGVK